MRSLQLLAVLAFLSVTAPPWRVGLRSFGPIAYGTTIREASRILGETLHADTPEALEGCGYISPKASPPGTAFMLWDSILVRVDIDTPGVATRSGAQVGSTEEEIKQLYPGRIRTEGHPYDGPEAHYLIYDPASPADTGFGMIFETDGHRVTRYRAGLHSAVDLIEGCA